MGRMRGRSREGIGRKCAAEPLVLGQERIMIANCTRGTCDGSELYLRQTRLYRKVCIGFLGSDGG